MTRILFDQNVPRALARLLPGHEVRTTADEGWGELQNGDLLRAAADAGFEAMVSCDQNIVYQQDMRDRGLGLVVLSTNHWATLRGNPASILDALDRLEPAGYRYVECGSTPKRRRPGPEPWRAQQPQNGWRDTRPRPG